MRLHIKIVFSFFIFISSCKDEVQILDKEKTILPEVANKEDSLPKSIDYFKLFKSNQEYISDGFDFPVGKPNAKGYYNAQKFKENDHLGDDWNGRGGGNTDLRDPIYNIGNGYVSEVKDYNSGWGNVVQIVHQHKNKLYKSLYAHCDTIMVSEGDFVKRGKKIATIGNCNGQYLAHLHLEIRDSISLDIGGGYSQTTKGYLDPTQFIKDNRTQNTDN